jgi:hypothetical protein
MANTIATLKKAIRESGRDIEIEESAINYERSINLYLKSETEQFIASGGLAICGVYYDEPLDRQSVIAFLIKDITEGFEPMDESTKEMNDIGEAK